MIKKTLRSALFLGLLINTSLLHAQSALAQEKPSIQGFQIGMSLDDARKLNLKTLSNEPTLLCTGDDDEYANRILVPDEKNVAGIKVCWVVAPINEKNYRENIILSEKITATVTLTFMNNRLYEVRAISDVVNVVALLDALSSKYGPADEANINKVSNGFGQVRNQIQNTWLFNYSSLVFTAPDLNSQRLSIVLTDHITEKLVAELAKQKNADNIDL